MSILDRIVQAKKIEIAALTADVPIAEWQARAVDAPPPRDFLGPLKSGPEVRLIAEVKKASPSQGVIREDFDPVAIASSYEQAGASCVSVLTDCEFFQGSLDDLQAVRQGIDLPVLRKDFILDPIQIWQARAYGADAVLLIAECLTGEQLRRLFEIVFEAGMVPLVELYETQSLDKVLPLSAPLVGVNNRDLRTFHVDLQHSVTMRRHFSSDQVFVAESGIRTREDVEFLAAGGIDAMLVGQSLCEQADIGLATRRLLGKIASPDSTRL